MIHNRHHKKCVINALKTKSVIVILALQSCGWFDGIDKPKEHHFATYNWEGILYKNLGEEVWPNKDVRLTGSYRTSAGPKYTVLATGQTDINGFFRLDYTIDSSSSKYTQEDGLYEVRFELGGGQTLMTAPWKKSLERDICEVDYAELVLHIDLSENYSNMDTLFLYSAINEVDLIQNNLEFMKTTLNNGIVTRLSFLVSPVDTMIMVRQRIASSYDNSPKRHLANTGIGLKDIVNRVSAYYDDESDAEFENEEEYYLRGWPYTDTLRIHL